MLLPSPRHRTDDLTAWAAYERTARCHAQLAAHRRRVDEARAAIDAFVRRGAGYVGVSWGKDSVVVADMCATLLPLVWVRVEPICNPDCAAVRDAFLARHPMADYLEIEEWCTRDADEWHASGTLERGFARAARRFGDRYVSGIRAEESGIRKLRVMRHGLSGARTCAPLGRWRAIDVFGYLVAHDLPINPAYACTMNGLLDPARIRVSSLGGKRGTGHGRAEWERRYYGQELMAIEREHSAAVKRGG